MSKPKSSAYRERAEHERQVAMLHDTNRRVVAERDALELRCEALDRLESYNENLQRNATTAQETLVRVIYDKDIARARVERLREAATQARSQMHNLPVSSSAARAVAILAAALADTEQQESTADLAIARLKSGMPCSSEDSGCFPTAVAIVLDPGCSDGWSALCVKCLPSPAEKKGVTNE